MQWSSELGTGEGLPPTQANAAETGTFRMVATKMSGDGSVDVEDVGLVQGSELGTPNQGLVEEEAPSIVYVSIMDPIGGPSFRPSKTKPLPNWMNLLPNSVHRERERSKEEVSEPSQHELGKMRPANQSIPSDGTEDTVVKEGLSRSTDTPSTLTQSESPISAPEVPPRPSLKGRTAIAAFDTPDIPRDEIARIDRRSCTAQSSYMTAQEDFDDIPSRRTISFRRSPYRSGSHQAPRRNEGSSYFSPRTRNTTLDLSNDDTGSIVASPAPSSRSLDPRPPAPDSLDSFHPRPLFSTLSSEYLERYQPETAESKYEKYVPGKAKPILSKIKKRKEQELGQQAEAEGSKRQKRDVKGKGKASSPPDKEFGLDPARGDLQKELRNLFCEE